MWLDLLNVMIGTWIAVWIVCAFREYLTDPKATLALCLMRVPVMIALAVVVVVMIGSEKVIHAVRGKYEAGK